ncbi:protein LTV1 [Kwoniella heveanensis CBS 569]|nr:protein LTV1 [Kwoniella heveanensis CBS 569]
MPPKKSIFRGPDAQHFQLVHRSQQDPRINDPEASQRVFKSVTRGNDSGRKPEITLADLENSVDKSAIRKNEGEAALYGITYDDSSYDYMAHLKPVGDGGVFESVMIAAPRGGSAVARGMKTMGKGKGKAKDDDVFGLLPEDVLPSKEQLSVYEAQTRGESVPAELQGLQPDMDPHLRQVLEALDDDAFVDEDGDEDADWFGELVGDGEREEDVEVPWEFKEWGDDEGLARAKAKAGQAHDDNNEDGEPREETWEDRFKAFKRQQASLPDEVSDIDPEERSEMADTVGTLMSNFDDMMVVGGKKRRGKRGPSDASGMSMSSSSMFRTQGLRDLDDRFDKVEMDYLYDDDEEEEYEDFPDDDTASVAASNFSVSSRFSLASHASRAGGGPPEVSRDDFEAIMDDFLDNYEVVGRRLRPALGGTGLTGTEKLSVLRSAIEGEDEAKEENRRRIMRIEEEDRERMKNRDRTKKTKEDKERVAEPEEEKWDVQTILTTYTNTENHPAMIRSRTAAQAKARAEALAKQQLQQQEEQDAEEDSDDGDDGTDSGSETEREAPKVTVTRQKGETTEDKKARKAAVKAERSARRAEKKSHKETFSTERKRQLASHKKLVSNGRAADVAVGARGVVSLS